MSLNQQRNQRPPRTIENVPRKPSICPRCQGEVRKTAHGFAPSGYYCWACNVVWTVQRNGFQPRSGQYRCANCDKETRDTGYGEGSTGLCRECYQQIEEENARADAESC